MAPGRQLIVNADDFGQSHGVNRGVIQAHERGIVTSASLMVRWPAAVEAAEYAKQHPALSLGIHIDLGEWAFRGEEWETVYSVVSTSDRKVVDQEIRRQFDLFRSLIGCKPTHIDSHQHVHHEEPVRSILSDMARELRIPLRGFSGIRYCGDFYGQTAKGAPCRNEIAVEALIAILTALPAGITELGCHPGLGSDLETMYLHEREQEVTTLCDSRVRQAIASEIILLSSFLEI